MRVWPICVALLMFACGGAGLGGGVRTDITDRMTTIETTVSQCYKAALERDRKLKGTMMVEIKVAPKTGQFEKVTIGRNDLSDDELARCVVSEVSKLKLAKPQKTVVSVSYPLEFAPTK